VENDELLSSYLYHHSYIGHKAHLIVMQPALGPDISALSLKQILALITQHSELKEFTPNN